MSHSATLQSALIQHQSGRFAEAEQLYRQILSADPNCHEAWHLLGLMAHQLGQNPAAVDMIGRAVNLAPQVALYYSNLGLAWEALRQPEKAEYCFRRAINLDPNFSDAHNNLGILLHSLGRLPEAVVAAQRAVQLNPNSAEPLNNLANIYHAQGRLHDAEHCYRDASRLSPANAQILTNLGNVLADEQRLDEAERCYSQALELDPGSIAAITCRGNLYRKRKQYEAARECYSQVVQLAPHDAASYCNLGVVLADLQRDDEALAAYRQALELDQDHADTLSNYANLLTQHGRFAESETAMQRAIAQRPHSSAYLSNLGKILQLQGDFEAARKAFQRALECDRANVVALCNLGVTLYEMKLPHEALQCYDQALAQQPDLVAAWGNRATICADQGEFDEAIRSYTRAQQLAPNDGRQVRMALLTRVMYDSTEQMQAERERIRSEVARLQIAALTVTDPVADPGVTVFHLAYHGQNDRDLLASIAQLHRRITPSVSYTSPHIGRPRQPRTDPRPRIGFISRYFHNHPVGMHYGGVIERLPQDLHVSVFTHGKQSDSVVEQIRSRADEFVVLPTHLGACQQAIADRKLDALIYTDIGMDPLTYFLAFARLAPLQAVTTGHPITSGIDTVDFFLSSEWFETNQSAEHYTEQRVCFRSLPNHFTFPPPPAQRTRRDFGLPDGVPIYTCAQTLFKIHPDFDQLVDRILQADPEARVAFFADEQRLWAGRLQQRLAKQLGSRLERILWIARQKLPDFRAALALSDVVLDTPHFNGGTSSLEALAVGAPIVTWPSEFLRGRVTTGFYRKIGLAELIARDAEEYVHLAKRVAHDRPWRAAIVQQIAERRSVLFNNDEFALELAAWLRRRIAAQP